MGEGPSVVFSLVTASERVHVSRVCPVMVVFGFPRAGEHLWRMLSRARCVCERSCPAQRCGERVDRPATETGERMQYRLLQRYYTLLPPLFTGDDGEMP